MPGKKDSAGQINTEDLHSMRSWFKSHHENSNLASRTLEEYVELIRYALKNNDQPFLSNVILFCQKIGGPGFETMRAVPDLLRLTTLVK